MKLWRTQRAMAILVVAILAAACSSGTVVPLVTGPSQLAADVPDYRANVTRTGVMPGPGLAAKPVVLWRHADRSALVAPPAVAGGQVLVPEHSALVGLELSSGQRLWDVALGSTIAAPITVADGRVYATTANSVLHVIDLATRRELWRFEGAADSAQVSVQNGIAYVGTRSREFVALDPATGTRLWSVRTGKSSGKNAIAGGVAYVGGDGGSTLTAISLATRKILWTFETRSDRIATPALADGVVYVAGVAAGGLAGRNSRLFALDASTGRVIWRFAPPRDPPMAAFAVGAEDVFIGTDSAPGSLYAVDKDTGAVHWQVPIDSAVDRPALVDGVVYVGSGRGGLHAFDAATGRFLWTTPIAGYSEGVVVTGGIAVVATRSAPDSAGVITAFVAQGDPRAPGR